MLWLSLTDYKIHSPIVLKAVLLVINITALSLLLGEVFIDLRAADIEPFIVYFIGSLFASYLCIKNIKSFWGRLLIPLINFGMIEYVFLVRPEIFNTIIFWFPFVPVVAILVQDIRASQIWALITLATFFFNSYYVEIMVGDEYSLVVSRLAVFISGVIFLGAALAATFLLYNLLGNAYSRTKEKMVELSKLKDGIEQKTLRLTAFNAALIELTRNPEAVKSSTTLFESVCSVAQDSLDVNRVSIWLFEKSDDILVLKYLLENGENKTVEFELFEKDYPKYFKAVHNKPFIMANKAATHQDTAEFEENYLSPLGIQSMLDCPILMDQKAFGVVCCEHIDQKRVWEPEDALIIQSLADFIATYYKNEKIKELVEELKVRNKEIVFNSSMIESMNQELHQLNQKLVESNGSLEAAVDERTQELLIQNNQLKEYAFVNSHMLRAPISSILGISNLLKSNAPNDEELVDALHKSTESLDEVVRRISSTLEDGSNLTRKDIDYIINERFKNSEVDKH